jgi:hypothetical protein
VMCPVSVPATTLQTYARQRRGADTAVASATVIRRQPGRTAFSLARKETSQRNGHACHGQYVDDRQRGAVELVESKVDLMLVVGTEFYFKAAIAASKTVPIVVYAINYDPLALGYVKSLPRPGGPHHWGVFPPPRIGRQANGA